MRERIRGRSSAVVVAALTAVCGSSAFAADIAYSTGAVDANFSGINWAAGTDPTAAPTLPAGLADNLFFGGVPNFLTLNNDLTSAAFTGFTFNSDSSAFIFNGNAFTLGGNITNNSAATQTINTAITLDAVRTINTNTGNVTLSNAVTGAGGLIKEGTGTLTLQSGGGVGPTPVNTYAGGTTVNAGSVVAQRTSQTALGSGAVTVASGANVTITDHVGGSNVAYANVFNLSGSGNNGTGALKFFNSGLFSVTNAVNLSGGTVIATDPNSQSAANSVITFNPISGAGLLGSGGLTFASLQGSTLGSTTGAPGGITLTRATGGGSNLYTGDTRLTSAAKNTSAGATFNVTLAGNTSNRLPATTVLIFGGAYAGAPVGLDFDKSVTLTLAATAAGQSVAGLTTANTPAAGQAYRIVSTTATNVGFTVNTTIANTFNGSFGGTATNNNNINLTKSGTGSLTLGGASTYIGATTVSGGTLTTANNAALGTSAVSVTGTANLTLGDGTNNTVGGLTGLTMATGTTLALAATTSQVALSSGNFLLGNITLNLNNLFNSLPGDTNYTIIDNLGAGTGGIGTVTITNKNPSYTYAFNVVGNDGVLSITNVPEPTSLALLGLGGVGLLRRRVRTA